MDRKQRPTPEHATRILRAVQALADAKVERDAAMVDALKAGASVREVAGAAGMSVTQVQKIGHANGWPTPTQKLQWAAEHRERHQWDDLIEQYRTKGPEQ